MEFSRNWGKQPANTPCIDRAGINDVITVARPRWPAAVADPKIQLREDIGEIAGELIEEFKKTSALRTLGWMCIIDGTPQVVPTPVALL